MCILNTISTIPNGIFSVFFTHRSDPLNLRTLIYYIKMWQCFLVPLHTCRNTIFFLYTSNSWQPRGSHQLENGFCFFSPSSIALHRRHHPNRKLSTTFPGQIRFPVIFLSVVVHCGAAAEMLPTHIHTTVGRITAAVSAEYE